MNLLESTPTALTIRGKNGRYRIACEREVLKAAEQLLAAQIKQRPVFEAPGEVRSFLKLHLAPLEHEMFGILYLDAQHRLIAYEDLFRGSLTQTSVYPREVVKNALMHNAAAVVLAHNHPSGVAEPSQADRSLTDVLKRALDLVDVRVLDHFVVTAAAIVSFAERGWI